MSILIIAHGKPLYERESNDIYSVGPVPVHFGGELLGDILQRQLEELRVRINRGFDAYHNKKFEIVENCIKKDDQTECFSNAVQDYLQLSTQDERHIMAKIKDLIQYIKAVPGKCEELSPPVCDEGNNMNFTTCTLNEGQRFCHERYGGGADPGLYANTDTCVLAVCDIVPAGMGSYYKECVSNNQT